MKDRLPPLLTVLKDGASANIAEWPISCPTDKSPPVDGIVRLSTVLTAEF
jgi:hypothetical protein